MNKNKIIYFTAVVALVLIAALFFFMSNNSDTVPSNVKSTDKNLLAGSWLRTDASYLIKVIQVHDDKTLQAQYYNPRPINVESASWEDFKGDLKIIVVLRDTNYPGSTYTLNYLPDKDILAGEYYQAIEGATYYIEFTRQK